MKIKQSERYNEIQDYATATIGLIPVDKMTTELRNWCIWHNTFPDRIVLSPCANGDYFFTYGGDALLLAQHTGIKAYETFYNDREVQAAIVYLDQLEDLVADLVAVGITLHAIETTRIPTFTH